jgi:CRISPR type III-associated protein (TIGR04423 family)
MQQSIQIADIDFSLSYQGYLWYSNERTPRLFDNEPVTASMLSSLPFVMEGMLYAEAEQVSLSIRTINGQYLIHRTDLSNLSGVSTSETIYMTHRTPGFSGYKMKVGMKPVVSTLLAGLEADQPAWTAFTGFVK